MSAFEPLVSIVIPVWNGTNLLRDAINSALSQSYRKIEIIVVNDGSNDNNLTHDTCKSYGNKINYIQKIENGGTSTALNVGIQNMNGEYFCWLSHDDLYFPNFIEECIKQLNLLDNKNTIIRSDLIETLGGGITGESNYYGYYEEFPIRKESKLFPVMYMALHGCQLMFPKVIFERVGLFDETYRVAQDYEFFGRAFKELPSVLIPKNLGIARNVENSQGKRLSHLKGSDYSQVFIKLLKNLSNEDIKKMKHSKLDFLRDMHSIYRINSYSEAEKYVERKIKFTSFRNDFVSSVKKKLIGYSQPPKWVFYFFLRGLKYLRKYGISRTILKFKIIVKGYFKL